MIEKACQELGLNVIARMTKAMAVNHLTPEENLKMQGAHIDWVSKHQCLGIWFEDNLDFKVETENLRESDINRIKVMRDITGTRTGADFSVLRLFYMHAVRSLFDYASPVLATFRPTHFQRLEVAQNKALRLMLGAPMWTRIANLQLETRIDPIAVRVGKNAACLVSHLSTRGRQEDLVNKITAAFLQRRDLFTSTTWIRKVTDISSRFGIAHILREGADCPSRDWKPRATWTPLNISFKYRAEGARNRNKHRATEQTSRASYLRPQ
ncbi:hypothetical protein Pcinc_002640 [Petrolisthes cinctipes]|uniref:Reverse transcriptase n=1 Tax=Petrolisthes cinctipes TaxID=88211 RepID=A0AAE1L5A6_PETCI|nr:hypothetical protein Pcinc_008880 [Petrolisthes cinctipes]KAK3893575.1 hypothetical protein Pcinc_002640 [Petrolisthes cinctipes]